MNTTAVALSLYIAITLTLTLGIVSLRGLLVVTAKKAIHSFAVDGADVSSFSNRLCRAHANCYETFPVIGGLLLLALVTDNTQITGALAMLAVYARLGQVIVHLLSTRAIAVNIRFAFFAVQLGIAMYWLYHFCSVFNAPAA